VFTDKNRIKEEVLAIKGELEQDVIGAGHIYGINRAKSYYSNKAYYDEKVKAEIDGKEIVKVIAVPNKLVNIVVK